jgi:pentose-5-phosphate-3-epimerase
LVNPVSKKILVISSASFSIIDDGGITLDNESGVVHAGVDEVVVGRRIFEGDLRTNIEKFSRKSTS